MSDPSDHVLRQWLLQRLASEEAEPLERRLLDDAAFAERLREAETDLLDDLVRGRLDAGDREVAMRFFTASARQRQRLAIAEALAQAAAAPVARFQRRRGRWLAGGAAVAAALVAAAIGLHQRVAEPPTAGDAATVTLLASTQRSAGAVAEVPIAAAAQSVRLQAEVETDGYYGLEVLDRGRVTFRGTDLPARANGPYRYIEATVPAKAFDAAAVEVRVVAAGGASAESWSLRIRRR